MSLRRLSLVLVALPLLSFAFGCGSKSRESSPSLMKRNADRAAPDAAETRPGQPAVDEPVNAEFQDDPAAPPAAKFKRKIKYSAEIRLIVDDFAKSEAELERLVVANDGFIAFADVSTIPGQPRFGRWTARVPVAKFDEFRRAVAAIGDVERNNIKADDVTAQFYDLENHIKNQKAHEEALRELLKKTTDKMENLLAVRRELASVRDAIERSEGQLRVLANLTELTTVAVSIQERLKFVPETAPERAEKVGFGARVSRSFTESWRGLVEFAEDLAVVGAGLAPWLPPVAVVGVVFVVVARRIRRRWKSPPPAAARMQATEPPAAPPE